MNELKQYIEERIGQLNGEEYFHDEIRINELQAILSKIEEIENK